MERTGRVGIGELEVSHKLRTPDPQFGGYTGSYSPTPTELLGCLHEVEDLPEGTEAIPAPGESRVYGLLDARRSGKAK